MPTTPRLSLLLLAALACGPTTTPVPAPSAPPRTTLTGPPVPTAPEADDLRFHGRVQERLLAGPYTYLNIATDAGPRWVVTMGAAPGADLVEVRNMGVAKNFHARRLGREFDELVFGIVAAAPSALSSI